MTNAGDDGKGEIGNILCQLRGVRTAHVGRCSATSYYNNHVRTVGLVVDLIERLYDALLHGLALHNGGKELCVEHQPAAVV